jgi:phosphatidylglycerophosphatase A
MSVKAKGPKGKRLMPPADENDNSDSPGVPRWPLWIITLGGAGLLKPAPGTWGSLAAILVLYGLHTLTPAPIWPAELIVGILALGITNVCFGKWIEQYFGRKDPGSCVIDEGAGICLTLLALPPMAHPWLTFAAAFAAFRLFDILKLPPARQLEHLPLGWGILMDDLAAAVYANLLCQIVLRYALHQ